MRLEGSRGVLVGWVFEDFLIMKYYQQMLTNTAKLDAGLTFFGN